MTKIGFPYGDDLTYRYIEITSVAGYRVRHFYVQPASSISNGVMVKGGDVIGSYQSLNSRFPEIIEHVHIEVYKNGNVVDPTSIIP